LLRPYPHIDTDRWAYLYEQPKVEGLTLVAVSVPNFRDWKEQSRSFSDLVLWLPWSYNVSGSSADGPERVEAAVITPDVFTALGVRPAAGRLLLASDKSTSTDRPVLISHGLWERRFGRDPAVAGKLITLNLVPHTVVGVAPPEFSFPPETRTDVWTPYSADAVAADTARGGRGMRVAGRLAPGRSFESAQNELSVIADRLAREYPENQDYGVRVVPMREGVSGEFRSPLLILFGALGLVLLLACVNLANLQLVRLEGRRKELALRAAVGAGRLRLARQLVAENLVLVGLGAGAGLLLSPMGTRFLLSFVPAGEVPYLKVDTDAIVLAGFAGVTALVALLSGVLPALASSRIDLVKSLAQGPGTPAGGRRVRHLFLVAQVAMSLVPLVAAALLVQSFDRLRRVDPGFATERRLTLSFSAPRARYATPEKIAALAEAVRDEVDQAPGVSAAGAAQHLPFAPGIGWLQAVSREDPRAITDPGRLPHVRYNVVTTRYVEALGLPLKAGRTFTRADSREAAPVVVVNEALARMYFPGEDPLGQRLWVGHAPDLPTSAPRTIVGVIGNALVQRLEDPVEPAAWVPVSQQEAGDVLWRTLFLVAHTQTDPRGAIPAVRAAIARVDADLALTDIETMGARLDASVWRQRLSANVLMALGVAALAIAVLGVFGLVGYLVSQRVREIGLRMALGATRGEIGRMVMGEGLRLVLCGVGLGLAGAWAATRSLSSLLYGVSAHDPATFGGLALVLALAALLACAIPARRAARMEALTALRHE
jgi:predicted permease